MAGPPLIIDSEGGVRPGKEVAVEELRLPPLVGVDITCFVIDYDARLQFEDVQVVISAPFILHQPGGEQVLDPEVRSGLGPLLALIPATLASVAVDGSSTLLLTFTSGAAIEVPADFGVEPWQINGPGDALIVCRGTGSGFAVWQ